MNFIWRVLLALLRGNGGAAAGASQGASGADLDLSAPIEAPAAINSLIIQDGAPGSEDDQRITVKDVEVAPWRPLVCLRLVYSDGSPAIGSGILVGPDLILTAAHNLYALDLRSFIRGGVAMVGVKNGVPAAQARLKRVEVCPGYTRYALNDPGRYKLDFGVARVDSDALYRWAGEFVNVAEQTPIADSELVRSRLNVAGYPDKEGALRLKTDSGPILPDALSRENFRYRMDTMPGQSGCPVFRYHADTKAVLYAGVHVAGDRTSNLARRYDPAMQAQLKAWMQALA